jgi:hypothetical protein
MIVVKVRQHACQLVQLFQALPEITIQQLAHSNRHPRDVAEEFLVVREMTKHWRTEVPHAAYWV